MFKRTKSKTSKMFTSSSVEEAATKIMTRPISGTTSVEEMDVDESLQTTNAIRTYQHPGGKEHDPNTSPILANPLKEAHNKTVEVSELDDGMDTKNISREALNESDESTKQDDVMETENRSRKARKVYGELTNQDVVMETENRSGEALNVSDEATDDAVMGTVNRACEAFFVAAEANNPDSVMETEKKARGPLDVSNKATKVDHVNEFENRACELNESLWDLYIQHRHRFSSSQHSTIKECMDEYLNIRHERSGDADDQQNTTASVKHKEHQVDIANIKVHTTGHESAKDDMHHANIAGNISDKEENHNQCGFCMNIFKGKLSLLNHITSHICSSLDAGPAEESADSASNPESAEETTDRSIDPLDAFGEQHETGDIGNMETTKPIEAIDEAIDEAFDEAIVGRGLEKEESCSSKKNEVANSVKGSSQLEELLNYTEKINERDGLKEMWRRYEQSYTSLYAKVTGIAGDSLNRNENIKENNDDIVEETVVIKSEGIGKRLAPRDTDGLNLRLSKSKSPIETSAKRPTKSEEDVTNTKPQSNGHLCDACGKLFGDLRSYNMHLLSHTKGHVYWCDVCDKGFKKKTNLKVHQVVHTNERPFQCDTCGYKFKHIYALSRHMKRHVRDVHANECTQCDAYFNTKVQLKCHMRSVHVARTHACSDCGKTYKSKGHLKEHAYSHAKTKLFQCDICHKEFSCKSYLKRHTLMHKLLEKPYSCTLCSYAAFEQGNLRRHMDTHRNTKYKCEYCPKVFINKESKQSHVRFEHTNPEAKEHCNICQKSFREKGRLREHMERHLGTGRHACDTCGKVFLTKTNLKYHNKAHWRNERYDCEICDRSYKYKFGLNRHVKKEHTSPI